MLSLPTLAKAQSTNVTLSLTTNNKAYYSFNPFTVSGLLQSNGASASDGLVGLEIQDSAGKILVIRTLRTGTSTPSSLSCQISSAYLSDMSGNPQNSIQTGALGYFTVDLVNNADVVQTMLVTINLYDNDGIPIGQISEQCSLLANTSGVAILSIQIPTYARSGIAYGFADVYSDWPSNDGVPLGLEQAFQFTILNGLSSIGSILSSNSNQGTYSLTFRLPTMGPANDNYTVYASTSYAGSITTESTKFNCEFGDFTSSGTVDSTDFFIFTNSFISYSNGNSNYNPLCDMNQDGKIDSQDFFAFLNCYIAYWSPEN